MSLSIALRAAQLYSDAEATRQASFGLLPQVTPDLSPWSDIKFKGGAAHLAIDPRHKPRTFDVPVAFFLKIAVALGGNILLNSREKRGREARIYVRLDIGTTHVYVNRIIMDAQPGLVVREVGNNFRSHLPEDLVIREAPLRDGPNKHITGRWDAIAAILEAYDRADEGVRATITRQALEDLLTGLLVLADGRASERRMMKAKGAAA